MKRTYHYSFITIVWLSFCLASCASRTETPETKTPPDSTLIAENISKADELAKRRDDSSKLREAIKLLAQIELSTGLVGGKPEKAIEYLEKAIELEKENSYTRLHLAQAYLATNRDAEAKKQLDYILQKKPNTDFLPEYEESLKEAKKLLATRF